MSERSGQWKWSAKKIADNKFSMRFPTAKMILDYANFNHGVKGLDVQFTMEPWTSAMGAKGQLQQAWFRVSGIPIDQRGLRKIAKIGGLVGKTLVIDERTRFNKDFARLKIAWRYVNKVPYSAESTLGLYIYDFFFEKQSSQFHEEDNQRTAERVEIPESQPCPKKQKTNNRPGSAGASGSKSGKIVAEGSIKSGGKHVSF